MENPFAARLESFRKTLKRRHLDCALVFGEANVRSLTGIVCDNACLAVGADGEVRIHTDFRYVPMMHRVAPWIRVGDIRKLGDLRMAVSARRIGIEFSVSHARHNELAKAFSRAKLVDIGEHLSDLRAVKTAEEIMKLRAAERLDCEIWRDASGMFRPGMTELDMSRIIRKMMVERGDGEAFETIVSVGANAAECHHVPDSTVWNGREAVLVDMGVKLGGYCSDLTRNILPKRPSLAYRKAYELVRSAHDAAIDAVRPGITGKALDAVARRIIAKGGFGKCFGHSLGHGVGIDIHEAPAASRKSKSRLKAGMLVTIEPGIYLEDDFGIRIEDLVLVTDDGCEVLSKNQGRDW